MLSAAADKDERKYFIVTTSGNYFGVALSEEAYDAFAKDPALDNFLDDCSVFTLSAIRDNSGVGGNLCFSVKVVPAEGKENTLVFFKLRPEVITQDNLHSNVFVSSMVESPITALYHAIQKVYSPILLKDDSWSGKFDPKLQDLIAQLEAGLRNTLEKSDKLTRSGSKEFLGSMSVIMSPEEEVQFWSNIANTTRRKDEREMGKLFYNALEPLSKEFSTLESLPLSDVDRVLEAADSVLDDLWKLDEYPYPQHRMEHLMDVIGNTVTRFIQKKLKTMNFWEESFNIVEESLNKSISICDKWITSCERLTSLLWPNYTPHPWSGNPFSPTYTQGFASRLREVLQLRVVHRQLTRLLSCAEQEELKVHLAFAPLSGLSPAQYNRYTDPLWRSAVGQFERALVPVEERAAGKLRVQLRHVRANTLQLLQEFKRYRDVIGRPAARQMLAAEREGLLGALGDHLRALVSDFSSGRRSSVIQLIDMPEIIGTIYWVRQLECQVADIESTSSKLLDDLPGHKELQVVAGDLLRDLKEFHSDQFDSWTREIGMAIHNKKLSLQTDEPVVYFEQGKLMHVNYNPRLVGLIREVRQLAVLGYKIPVKIQETADLAKKFMRQAKALEQVANFHNTIGDRMIPSQRPMMLKAALELAQLVQEQNSVTWSDTAAVDRYISKLQALVERLCRENNKLNAYHAQIRDKVVQLMDTDLLRHQQQWKDILKDIRAIMSQVESQNFSNMRSWRAHWDHQLYKALEHQYQLGLEALDQHLPEIKIELVYRQQELQFRPPMEEIRMKYYGQLKRFLSIPNNFRGVSDSSDSHIFPIIIERNAERFRHVFAKAEELFSRLKLVRVKWHDCVALGSVDLNQLAEEHLSTAEHWERNFKATKVWSQEIAKLPSCDEKVECFSVSLLPVRAEMELHNRRYWDTLVSSLQSSVVRDVAAVEKFIGEATQVLNQQPSSVEEIGTASAKHSQIMNTAPEMFQVLEEVQRKNKTLASWTKEHLEQVNRVVTLWDNFQSMLDNYQFLISRQVEGIRNSLTTQVENLSAELEKFRLRWEQMKPREMDLQSAGENVLQRSLHILRDKRHEWGKLFEAREALSKDCIHFGMEPPELVMFEEIENDLKKHEEMWSLFDDFNSGLQNFAKEEWIIFRSKTYKFEEFLLEWQEKLKSSKETTILTVRLLQDVERYKEVLPLLKFVRGEIFSDKHWLEMFGLVGIPSKPIENLVFGDFLSCRENILTQANNLQDLNSRASSEIVIRQALGELDIWEVEAKFSLLEHKDSRGTSVMLIIDFKDILNKVGDNQCLLQSIKNSPNYNNFVDRASIWESRLADLDEFLHSLNQIQRKWVYLEPIFSAGTLTQDQARFQRIDQDFRYIMADVAKDQKVVSLCRINNLHQILNTLLDQLSRCQKSLNDFLEEKRSAFPRFCFLGDEDLLEILGQSTRHNVIQAHLKKLFSGIHAVSFDAEGSCITAMKSIDGETVPLKKQVKLVQQVEVWLAELASEMKSTLRQLLLDCVQEGERTKSDPDPSKYPSQVLCLAESVLFTRRCEEAISSGGLRAFLGTLQHQLEAYASLELEWAEGGGQGEGEGDLRDLELKLKALLLDTIHHIGVVEELVARRVAAVDSWHWQRQLRFYINKSGVAVARMVDAEFEYTYEYQGNASKLVHTPLIDKCYLTLTQGMHMGLGGNPYGPAGTGKTESVKALGGLLGRQVLVFNCDEGIDVKSMGRIFIGLVKCGAWGCFDEFNRLEEATLSAVSMQIQPIQFALKNKHKVVRLLNEEISIDSNSGIFVTMNPAGKGYGGRQKLPDNLKQLFRPVVMSQPDNELIAEVILYSEGFRHAKKIGRKIVELFNLARTLLSAQQHYDWGLRALKTVLRGCGAALKARRRDGGPARVEQGGEAELAVQALRLNTMSKLTFRDRDHLDALVRDVFPGVPFTSSGHERLVRALADSYAELGLSPDDDQLRKCMELYEQLQQRIGVVIVGPSGSGKSTVCRLVKNALSKLGVVLRHHTINPKAMPRTQLLGHIDLDTRQWTDGVLTLSAQQVYSEPADVHSWIVCDGDVDPEWVESLNSVLDDNRLLTLPSGWRIQFGPNVNFIFETHDLSYASPATVSRMGMIFLSDEDMNIKGLVSSWLKTQVENTIRFLGQFIDDYFYKAVDWVVQRGELVVGTSLVGLVQSGLSQLHGVSTRAHFTVALVSGLGGNLTPPCRDEFAKQVFQWTGEFMPEGLHLQHLFYNASRDCVEAHTMDRADHGIATPTGPGELPLVPTPDVKKTVDVVSAWLRPETRQPFLVVGPQGCGKSLILNHCFSKLRATDVAVVHCSAQITPLHVLQKLNQVCMVISSNMGRVYRPRNCDHLILYFKDINLARPDKWGTSMLVSFLQQLITYRGFYDSNMEWVGLENFQIVGSMTADGGTGHTLTTRFTSITRIYAVSYPEKEQLQTIYNIYLTDIMSKCLPKHPVWKSSAKVTSLTSSMITVYQEVKTSFTAVQQNHYLFTPRDLTRWCFGLFRYNFQDEDKTVDAVLEAVIYEGMRLFRDKLVSEKEQSKFDTIVNNVFKSYWNMEAASECVSAMFFVTSGTEPSAVTGMLPTFGRPLGKMMEDDWAATVNQGIVQYCREGQALDVLVSRQFLELVASADHVLSAPHGSLLLAGRAATGRRAAVKVVSALHGARLLTLHVGHGYRLNNFRNDLKNMMQLAAVEGEQVYFVLEEHQLIDVSILDMINSLLLSGEVPGLYNQDELESVISPLKDVAAQDGFVSNLAAYFADRVRRNLHVVLVLDVTSRQFTEMCESNPAFYKECRVLWLPGWRAATLRSVPRLVVDRYNSRDPENARKKVMVNDDIVNGFVKIHSQAPDVLASPQKYVSFVQTYIHIYGTKIMGIEHRQKQLQAGVSKLTEARQIVDTLKVEANEQEKKLAEKQAKANAALQMITETMRSANTQKVEMESLKEQTERENQQLVVRKKAIDEELAEIEPLIQEARAAIGNIKSEALSEIRSLRAPPDIIRDILEGVLRLMGILDTSWNSMKTFLAKRGVKEDIRSLEARRITAESRQAVEKLLRDKSESFDARNARRASAAAAPLAAWVSANVRYSRVLEKIRPLEAEQSRLQGGLRLAEDEIGRLSLGLEDVDQRVAGLRQQLSAYTREAAEVEMHLGRAQETLAAAQGLVRKLDDEYRRWQEQLGELSEDRVKLPAFSLLAAACIVYLSASSEDARASVLSSWEAALGIGEFSLSLFLGSEKETLQWLSEGLPSGQLSIQNAVIILQTSLRPFIIDPSTCALEWLKKHLRDKTVEVTLQNSSRFATTLELAIRFGKVLIIQDVDFIEPMLFPVLRGEFINQGPRKVVQLGDKLIDYNDNFQLFFTSRNVNPELSPSSSAVITVVNFTMTQATLADQLLASVLRLERPELEQRRVDLMRKEEELKLKVDQLQEVLLHELANAQGDILQNKELLSSLNEAKANSAAVHVSLSESKRLQAELEQECDVYRPLAESGSRLFFVINELRKVNAMYQFSEASFTRLFQEALKLPEDGAKSDVQMQDYQQRLEHLVYYHVTRALFKADHLLLALHLVRHMHPSHTPDDEWDVFTGLAMADTKLDVAKVKEVVPKWIEEERQFDVFVLKTALPALYSQLLLEDAGAWQAFWTSAECEGHFPVQLARRLSPFQQVLLVQALRPDRLRSALAQMAARVLALKDLSPSALNLRQLLSRTLASEPVLLLISPGADPSEELRCLARASVGGDRYHEVALGEGQVGAALERLRAAARAGDWLCLKNLHLMVSWLPALEKEIRALQPHQDFRLWLTSEPHPGFPPILAQQCLKITYEAPRGVKRNLLQIYTSWGPELKPASVLHGRSLFALAWFHAVLLERRTFIPQGWAKFYEFSDADLRMAREALQQLFGKGAARIDWEFIHGLYENAIYGGHVDNMSDIRVVASYLQELFNTSVLEDGSMSLGPGIRIPSSTNYKDYLEVIQELSDVDKPQYFGLPENVERSLERVTSRKVINQLKSLKRPVEGKTKFDRDEWQKQLTPVLNLWKKLNQGLGFVQMKVAALAEGEDGAGPPPQPVAAFVGAEFRRGVLLVQAIHRSLAAISKVVRGSTAPRPDLAELAAGIMKHQTPPQWQREWGGPAEPLPYLRGVVARVLAVQRWGQKSEQGALLREPLDLADLFRPGVFLCALKQQTARGLGVVLDELVLLSSWSKNGLPGAHLPVVLSHLQLEGASLDGPRLVPNTAGSPSVGAAPPCTVAWMPRGGAASYSREDVLRLPLYETASRESEVVSLDVPCPGNHNKWIQAGVAFFLRS